MRILTAKPSDNKGILRLYLQFNEDRVKSGVGDAQYKYLEGEMPWTKTLTDDECTTLIGKERNIILGFITLRIPQFNPFNKVGKLAWYPARWNEPVFPGLIAYTSWFDFKVPLR